MKVIDGILQGVCISHLHFFWWTVEGRLYNESMTGATAKSKPKSTKIDEKELARLQRQDYWLQVSRAKLVMDLIFVCECPDRNSGPGKKKKIDFEECRYRSLRSVLHQTGTRYCESIDGALVGYSKVGE
jgi:hypothetical protein